MKGFRLIRFKKIFIFLNIVCFLTGYAIADESVMFNSPRDRVLNGEKNFSNKMLHNADFSGLDLRGVNFVGADLEKANFQCSDLRGANFSRADLEDANLKGANIDGVIFKDTEMEYTIWIDGKVCGEDSIDGCW